MPKNYVASKEDLKAIERALGFANRPKMKFVFSNLSKIAKTSVISYDSKYIYIWQLNPVRLAVKIGHDLIIPNKWQTGWWASIVSKEIEEYLPAGDHDQVISGGLLTPFIKLQRAKNVWLNPYISRESYLATIIHELGHVYWNSYRLWWYSNKKENLRYLKLTTDSFRLPSPAYLSEVFAFCTEYYVSRLFWKNHKTNLDIFTKKRLNTLINLESKKNLDREDSTIEPTRMPHDFASILGKIILTKYSKDWPKILTKPILI